MMSGTYRDGRIAVRDCLSASRYDSMALIVSLSILDDEHLEDDVVRTEGNRTTVGVHETPRAGPCSCLHFGCSLPC